VLVPKAYLNSCFYIYPSKDQADRGAQAGGTGFFVAVPIPTENTLAWQLYAVTAGHVVKEMKAGDDPTIRVNLVGGKRESLPTNRDRWKISRNCDAAAIPIDLEYETFKYWFIHIEEFVNAENSQRIGVGDDTFMVGRFKTQEGEHENTPTARFGNIAMMPGEQPNFLVEHRSLPGFSGSPTFVWINPWLPRLPKARIEGFKSYSPQVYGPWLLGVDSCHIQDFSRLLNSDNAVDFADPPRWIKSNTGMAEIVPAWEIAELLNCDEFRQEREQDAKRIDSENKVNYRGLEATTEEPSPKKDL
jgi:hypothetical protein